MLYSHVVSAYEKIYKTEQFTVDSACLNLTAIKGDTVSFQVVYYSDETLVGKVKVESAFGKHLLARSVEYVPATCPYRTVEGMYQDGNYTKTKAFECPDVLRTMRAGRLKITKGKYRTVRIDIDVPERFKAGDYTVKVTLENAAGEVLAVNEQKVKIYNAVLPAATLKHTEWFHTDCIADYYGYEVFSEKHWAAIESFMKTATKRGINMILTPIFTPPLDTEIGGERTTVQLIDVVKNGDTWSFGFDKLDRWVSLALKCGYKYFEISHLFTQWGANAATKVMATVDGEYKRVFGWDTPVIEGVYPDFLSKCLPALCAHLRELGVAELCYFHISDEPSIEHIENYERCKKYVAPYIEGFKTMDALSKVDFYKTGLCELPVPSIGHIEDFYALGMPELWSYYCCGPITKTTNRFMTYTLTRIRAIGIQWFKYRVKGFLHWGYNFYNNQFSIKHINPYKIKPGEETFPSGDSFIVYPGAGGKCEESARLMALYAAQTDLRALNALAEKTSYEHVLELIEAELNEPVTFESYPKSEYYYVNLRNKVNRELAD